MGLLDLVHLVLVPRTVEVAGTPLKVLEAWQAGSLSRLGPVAHHGLVLVSKRANAGIASGGHGAEADVLGVPAQQFGCNGVLNICTGLRGLPGQVKLAGHVTYPGPGNLLVEGLLPAVQ